MQDVLRQQPGVPVGVPSSGDGGNTVGARAGAAGEGGAATSRHASATPSRSVVLAGNLPHPLTAAGNLPHPLTAAGTHLHPPTAAGNRLHPLTAAGNHLHPPTAAGNLLHPLTAAGNHLHSPTAAGNLLHTLTAAGNLLYTLTGCMIADNDKLLLLLGTVLV